MTFQCSLDGAAFTACTSPKSYGSPTPLAPGSHTFQVQAVSGGKSSGSTSYTWTTDITPPTASSITRTDATPSKANPLRFTVTFSEPVSGVTAANFSAAKGAAITGTPTVGSPTPNGGSAPQTTWTVAVSTSGLSGTGAADSTIGLNLSSASGIKDAAGNTLSTSSLAGQTYVFDTTAPTVSSINLAGSSPTSASSVSWTATFSEPVTGLSTSNFSLGQTGLSGTPKVTGVSGSGTTWTVTASTGSGTPSGSGTLQLNLSSGSGITDLPANSLGGSLPFNGQTYTIDKTPSAAPILDTYPPNPNDVSTSNFTWHDTSADVDHYLCSTENGSFAATVQSADGTTQPCSSPLSYVVETTNNGTHQFAVEAVDKAGNVSSSTSYSWKVQKGSIQNFTISGDVPANMRLYPNGQSRTIPVTFHNPNNVPIYVTAFTVSVDPNSLPTGCMATWFPIAQSNISTTNTVTVPANGIATLPQGTVGAATISMTNSGDQDVCQGATFTLDYTGGSAHS